MLLVVKDLDDPPGLRWIWADLTPELPQKVIPYLASPNVHFPYGNEVEPDNF